MKSLQRIFSGRKGDEEQKAFSPNASDSNMYKPKTKSFWKRISPKSVTYFSKSSNRSGGESRPQSPSPVIDSLIDIPTTRPISHKSNSLDSLDLRHDAPRIRLHERPLSPEDMGMIRYEEDDEEDGNQRQYHASPPPPYEVVNRPSAATEQPQYQHQSSFKDNCKNSDVFRMGSQNRSDSLGIKYVDADDFSSDEEEEDNQRRQTVPSERNDNQPPPAARKSSHNISQHAIDALLGMSTKSQDYPTQLQQKYKGPHNSFQQSKTTKPDEASVNDVPIFAISSDKESEMDMHPQRLFDNRPVDRNSFNNSNKNQINTNNNKHIIISNINNNNNTFSPPYESTRPISVDEHHSSGSGNNLNQKKSPEKERYSATRRIASPPTSRPTSDSSTSSSVTQTITLQKPIQGTMQQSPSISVSTPLIHSHIRQTVPFDGSVPPESSSRTERCMFFPPEVSPSDVINFRQTPPQQQGRNLSPQRLPSRRMQSLHQAQPATSTASVATVTSGSNTRPQMPRQGSASRRSLATSSTELVGPGVAPVPSMQQGQSFGLRHSQHEQDFSNARRRSLSPSATTNTNNVTGAGSNNCLSLQGNRHVASQNQHQSQYGNMNLSSMSVGNIAFGGSSMILPSNSSNPSNSLGVPTMLNNNLALQQAILQQQQMQQLQQQQLQQLQQQQQQLQLMAAMGMATVPMVAANGMIYQQPIMTVMQNNAIAMNSLTNSLTATAASLALISASATPIAATSAAVLPVASAATGLLTSSFTNNTTTNNMSGVISLEEQLLNRQRQVERENDMQLHMAIEQSLQETYHHQSSQQTMIRQVQHRNSSTTLSSASSASSAISGSNYNLHHINAHQHPQATTQSRLASNNNSACPSRSMSPSNHQLHRRPSTNNSSNNNRSHPAPPTLLDDDSDDAALQLALMMSLEEQLHEQQSAYQQVAHYEQQYNNHNNYETRSRSPPIREQQRQLLSRQTSRHASPGVPHGTSSSPMISPSYSQSHESLRAPSRERLIQYQRRTREEILQERQSRSASPAVTTGQQYQYCAPLSRPMSGVTSRAASNHSSFHEDHHPSVAPPSYQEALHHNLHSLLPPSYVTATENTYAYDAGATPEYTAFPPSPPAYKELEQEPKAYTAKTLVRRSVSTERVQGGRI